jgi:hypothetical protein
MFLTFPFIDQAISLKTPRSDALLEGSDYAD